MTMFSWCSPNTSPVAILIIMPKPFSQPGAFASLSPSGAYSPFVIHRHFTPLVIPAFDSIPGSVLSFFP